jgi:hypothetical protein
MSLYDKLFFVAGVLSGVPIGLFVAWLKAR